MNQIDLIKQDTRFEFVVGVVTVEHPCINCSLVSPSQIKKTKKCYALRIREGSVC